MTKNYEALREKIRQLSDGKRTSAEIASLIGHCAKFVQNTWRSENLPRPAKGPRPGLFGKGYAIDRDGYVIVLAPRGYKTARRPAKNRKAGRILLHRFLMELKLGRYLKDSEVVDHIDGKKLNNCLENLCLYSSNGRHLEKTLSGKIPNWTEPGKKNFRGRCAGRLEDHERVHTYQKLKRSGEIRSRQMSLLSEQPEIIQRDLSKMRELLKTRLALYYCAPKPVWAE